ncbi:hypothetical protein [Cryobacterium sp. Y82]|uniref:hypothetical protein n=1 Tax=Cryobacterium sp. Y82 TaxID=2045017 RepID=UPI001E4D8ED6|nr:hypothetical protein [Cryobacterium sp. Y82]
MGITALNALLFLVAPATAMTGAMLLGEPLTLLTLAGFALCGGVSRSFWSLRREQSERMPESAAIRLPKQRAAQYSQNMFCS